MKELRTAYVWMFDDKLEYRARRHHLVLEQGSTQALCGRLTSAMTPGPKELDGSSSTICASCARERARLMPDG